MFLFLLIVSLLNFQPCAEEDSTNCYWNAQEQGNGEGNSFIAFSEAFTLHFSTKEN